MRRCSRTLLLLALAVHTCGGPIKGPSPTTEENYGVHPLFGPLTPSQDVRQFVESVFRQGSGEDATTTMNPNLTTADSGERLRPTDPQFHPNMGFDLYWPGGEWVVRKSEVDRCNSSSTECSEVFQNYGPVCAGSADLGAHHMFDNMCELRDANCRDGTASIMLTSLNYSEIFWYPVNRNGGISLKISSPSEMYFVLARAKDITLKPAYYFWYGEYNRQITLNTYHDSTRAWVTYEPFYPPWGESFLSTNVRSFDLFWNESIGQATWILRDKNYYGKYDQSYNYPRDDQDDFKAYYRFPVRYLGVYGGNKTSATWVEITGLPRGYLVAYRGGCREDLPTLPTVAPKNISGRHKIQLFNFAERMDEFGYNYTRVTGSTDNLYGGDYFSDYHAFP